MPQRLWSWLARSMHRWDRGLGCADGRTGGCADQRGSNAIVWHDCSSVEDSLECFGGAFHGQWTMDIPAYNLALCRAFWPTQSSLANLPRTRRLLYIAIIPTKPDDDIRRRYLASCPTAWSTPLRLRVRQVTGPSTQPLKHVTNRHEPSFCMAVWLACDTSSLKLSCAGCLLCARCD